MATASSVYGWYTTLVKPSFNPPGWVFGPVWTVLYVAMAVAGWRIWLRTPDARRKVGLIAYGAQLTLNLSWSYLFFGLQRPGLALVDIMVLFILLVFTTILYSRMDRTAGALFTPYLAWVAFAMVLNAAIWHLN
ncbi:MAG: tryptophan-rich sensory protein [Rhizobiales bacterium]|nr:tryptophan-rich sensory protein [Hyphomicrobiales bacterium]